MEPPFLGPSQPDETVAFYRSSPLMFDESFDDLRLLCPDIPSSFIELIQEAFKATREQLSVPPIYQSENDCQHDSRRYASAKTIKVAFHYQRFPINSRAVSTANVYKVTELAAAIHFRATRLGIPFENPANQRDVQCLGQLLNETPLSHWCGIPYIYLWMYAPVF
jgi:hypothetical protein